jgi:hypothetical protein
MGNIKLWGPATWLFFHTLVECIKDEHYDTTYTTLFDFIKQISVLLPCQKCSQHAGAYLKNIRADQLQTREQFRLMLFQFHNHVNTNKKLPLFDAEQLEMYKHQRFHLVLDNFFAHYQSKRDMSQLNQSFRRKLLTSNLVQWFQNNSFKFHFN